MRYSGLQFTIRGKQFNNLNIKREVVIRDDLSKQPTILNISNIRFDNTKDLFCS